MRYCSGIELLRSREKGWGPKPLELRASRSTPTGMLVERKPDFDLPVMTFPTTGVTFCKLDGKQSEWHTSDCSPACPFHDRVRNRSSAGPDSPVVDPCPNVASAASFRVGGLLAQARIEVAGGPSRRSRGGDGRGWTLRFRSNVRGDAQLERPERDTSTSVAPCQHPDCTSRVHFHLGSPNGSVDLSGFSDPPVWDSSATTTTSSSLASRAAPSMAQRASSPSRAFSCLARIANRTTTRSVPFPRSPVVRRGIRSV